MQMPCPWGSRSLSHEVPGLHSPPPFVQGLPMPLQLPAVGGHVVPVGAAQLLASEPASPGLPDVPDDDDPELLELLEVPEVPELLELLAPPEVPELLDVPEPPASGLELGVLDDAQ